MMEVNSTPNDGATAWMAPNCATSNGLATFRTTATRATCGATCLSNSSHPRELSGGQRQRVAMGRAIVRDPKVFLFDEPLSNLDAKLRVAMRAEIKALHQRLKTTTVYVTHDQIEAMTMADRIVVMHDGIVEQIGTPLELFDRPGNLFVAQFIGSPAMNVVDGPLRRGRRGRGAAARAGRCRPAAAARDRRCTTASARPTWRWPMPASRRVSSSSSPPAPRPNSWSRSAARRSRW